MILNIHGYDSSGKNSKYAFLASEYKDQLLISPSFDYSNENPYNTGHFKEPDHIES